MDFSFGSGFVCVLYKLYGFYSKNSKIFLKKIKEINYSSAVDNRHFV